MVALVNKGLGSIPIYDKLVLVTQFKSDLILLGIVTNASTFKKVTNTDQVQSITAVSPMSTLSSKADGVPTTFSTRAFLRICVDLVGNYYYGTELAEALLPILFQKSEYKAQLEGAWRGR